MLRKEKVQLIGLFMLGCLLLSDSAAKVHEADKSQFSLLRVPVFFVTGRKSTKVKGGFDYGVERSDKPAFGICKTLFAPPKQPVSDAQEKPCDLTRDDFSIDGRVEPESSESFLMRLHEARRNNIDRRLVVFVPGYACSFAKALIIGAHISTNVALPVVVFSWPSKNSVFAYHVDECTAEWSSAQLGDFLQTIGKEVGNENVIVIAHSMGSRIVNWAIERILAEKGSVAQKYHQILLCSPDVDSGVFSNDIAILRRACPDIRVYVSSKDLRLGVSAMLHGNVRLGSTRANLESIPGIQVIDVTELDNSPVGHSIPFRLLADTIRRGVAAKVSG